MTKFKVGDKAKVVALNGKIATATGAKIGEVVEIVDIIDHFAGRNFRCKYSESNASGLGYFSSEALELVPQSPTKNQRITTLEQNVVSLESEVAELKAKVEALEKAQSPTKTITQNITVKSDADISKVAPQLAKLIEGETDKRRKKMSLTLNEQRKAIIAEAKAFVATKTHYLQDSPKVKGGWAAKERENPNFCDYLTKAEFIVNTEKRTVVALIRYEHGSDLKAKGIAKCAPDDVFNADIGKAIALGRALGLDVSRFEQAVKPTGFAVGQTVRRKSRHWGDLVDKVCSVDCRNNIPDESEIIIDDTEAKY